MPNFILLIICFCAGMALCRSGKFPEDAHVTLNSVIIYLSLPALILLHLHGLHFSRELLYAAAMPWCLFLIGACLFFVVGRKTQLRLESMAALTLVGGLGNTSFVGIPMVEALHGDDGVPLAVIIDQAGTYLTLSTLGMLAVALYTSTGNSPWAAVRKIVTFPPFIAVCAAFLLFYTDYPGWLNVLLSRLSNTVAPLAVLSVGSQMRLAGVGNHLKPLGLGLLYKLFLCPLLVLAAYLILASPQEASESHVILLESAMGPQIGAGIVAIQHNLDPEFVTLMIGVGTILALFTVPVWSLMFLSLRL
jgi:predicted permease